MVKTRKHKLRKRAKSSKRVKSRKTSKKTTNKRYSRKHRGGTRRIKHIRNKTNKKKGGMRCIKMMGGKQSTMDAVPFVPPGGGYKVGSDTNGLDGGYYYNLAQPEIHAPNGTAQPSNAINVKGNLLKGGKRRSRRRSRRRSKRLRGGGLIPNDLVYLYRSTTNSLGNLYKGATGQETNPSTNPNPMYQPDMLNHVRLDSSVPDVAGIMNKAQHEASL